MDLRYVGPTQVKEPGGTHGWRWPHEKKSMVVVWTCDDDQALDLEKKKEENKMGSRQMYNYRAILFSVIKTL